MLLSCNFFSCSITRLRITSSFCLSNTRFPRLSLISQNLNNLKFSLPYFRSIHHPNFRHLLGCLLQPIFYIRFVKSMVTDIKFFVSTSLLFYYVHRSPRHDKFVCFGFQLVTYRIFLFPSNIRSIVCSVVTLRTLFVLKQLLFTPIPAVPLTVWKMIEDFPHSQTTDSDSEAELHIR